MWLAAGPHEFHTSLYALDRWALAWTDVWTPWTERVRAVAQDVAGVLICGSDPVLSGSGGRARSKCRSWALGQAIPYPVKLDLAFFKAGNRWRNLLQERGVGGPASMEFLLQPLNRLESARCGSVWHGFGLSFQQ